MKSIQPYLNFNGNCEEAFSVYEKAFNGKITSVNKFSEMPDQVPAGAEDLIMHIEMEIGDIIIYGSDSLPEQPVEAGSNMFINLLCESVAEQDHAFNVLKEGGIVMMAPEETFWGSRFAMLTDKFGINWMLDYSLEN